MPSKHENKAGEPSREGRLFVVATPIGNLADITLRALETLRSVHLIAAEDTRHTRKLLSHYDIHKPLVSYHSQNISHRGPELITKMQQGKDIALVTDAGTPGISDPGTLLVLQAIDRGVSVTVIPGATASIAALVVSGLPTHPFAFLGFPPAKGSGRRKFFTSHSTLPFTLVLYESPQRLMRTLDDILQCWGDRRIAVAREITKRYEEIFRGTVTEAQAHYSPGAKGELTLVVEGASGDEKSTDTDPVWRHELCTLLRESGLTVKEATSEIVRRHQLPRRLVYQEALKLREPDH